jgi:RNA polymerase-binding transcription factor DksA
LSDDIDHGQESEQADRDRSLAEILRRIAESNAPRNASIDGICVDCDEPIEPARLAALAHKTSRCASCAQVFELRNRGYRATRR